MENNTRGAWILGTDPAAARTIAEAPFDWIALDLQHGRLDDAGMLRALEATHGLARRWVRVRALDDGLIGRALDAGADGVIVPMVQSADDARAAASASRYPPAGRRSWGPFAGYGSPATTDGAPGCAVMIETDAGLRAVDDIATVAGVDALFVGPFDLALSLGMSLDALLHDRGPGSALRRIATAADRAGIVAAAFAGTPERAELLRGHGFRALAVATDTALLQWGASQALGGQTE